MSTLGSDVTFSAMISSGFRDGKNDPFHAQDSPSGPYLGPPMVYTCLLVSVPVPGERYQDEWSYDRLPCPQPLSATLPPGSSEVSVFEFSG